MMGMVSAPKRAGKTKGKVTIEALTSKDLRKRRPWMILATGDEGTGKTHFCLTHLLYAYYELGLDPEDCLMVIMDPDDGVARLLEVEVVPEELQERMIFYHPRNWKELIKATDDAYERLTKHVNKRGLHGWHGSILIVENMGLCWDWVQDDYVQDVYNKTLAEKALDASKIAQADEKKMHPTLSPMRDYGVINRKHDAWTDGIRKSGFNFAWTAHYKVVTINKGKGEEEVVREKIEGKRNLGGKVEIVIKFHQDGGKYLADVLKGRGLSNRVENRENMDFSEFIKLFKLLQKSGKKRRVEYFKKLKAKRQQIIMNREKAKREKEKGKVGIIEVAIKEDTKPEPPPKGPTLADGHPPPPIPDEDRVKEASEEVPPDETTDETDLSDLVI